METGFQVRSDLGREFSLSIYGVLSELGEAPFVASWIVLSKSGIVKNSLFCSILSDTLVENGLPVYECKGGMHHFAIFQ